jgi:hypothetical protein
MTETADEEFRDKIWRVWPFKDDDDLSEWKDQIKETGPAKS